MSENEEQPYYKHDCDRCVFLGNAYDHRNEVVGDMYWCKHPGYPSLDSVIFRYDSEASKYISAHPPNDFQSVEDYAKAYSWFPIIIGRATNRGLFNPNRKLDWDERDTSKMTEEEHDIYMKYQQYGWTIDLLKEQLDKTKANLVKRYGEMEDEGYHLHSSGDVQIFSCLKIVIEHMKAEREAL